MALKVKFITDGSAPTCPPNPAFPNGQDVDVSGGAKKFCQLALQYPAPSRGIHVVDCETCKLSFAVTAAGRPDDPRSVKVGCEHIAGEPVICRLVDCNNTARWQVATRLHPVKTDNPVVNGMMGLTNFYCCDGCRPLVTAEFMFVPEARATIDQSARGHGVTIDWPRAEVQFIELVKGDPMRPEDVMALAQRQFKPDKSKAN